MFQGSDRLLGPTHPHFQWVPVEGEFPRRQQLGCEADHSPPSIAEIMNEWMYTSTRLYMPL